MSFQRKEFQKQQIDYKPQEDDFVGPALPPQAMLDKAQETSSSEDEGDLQNDPIFQQSQKGITSNLQKKIIDMSNQQNADQLVQTEFQRKQLQKKLNVDQLLKKKQDIISSDEEEDDEALLNDPIFQQSIKGDAEQERKNELIRQNKAQRLQNQDQIDDTEEEKIEKLKLQIPYTSEVTLKGHQKQVTTIAIDNNGSRMATGSYDYFIRLWDFQGMNKQMSSFRMVEPINGHPLKQLSYSENGNHVLCIVVGPQFKLMDKEGRMGHISTKGDMYITDMAKTYGHVSEINDGKFHPKLNNIFATCSNDASIRIWDTNKKLHGIQQQMTQTSLIKCADQRGQKIQVNSLTYSPDGKYIFAGCQDGSIQGFPSTSGFHRPQFLSRGAHTLNEYVNCVEFFKDQNRLVSKSLDGSMKIWDIRKFNKPIFAHYNLDSHIPGTKVAISPCQNIIVTGHTEGKQMREKISYLDFYSANENLLIDRIAVGDKNITDIKWHSKLNQIVYAMGNDVNVLFDSQQSNKGANIFVNKEAKKKNIEDMIVHERPAHNPHALPLFRKNDTIKKIRKAEQEEKEKNKPKEKKFYGEGKQGHIKGASSVTSLLMKTATQLPGNREDAQQALLKLDEDTKRNPMYFKVYNKTQPKPIFDEETPQQEEQKYLSSIKEICHGCGLKICKCDKRLKYEDKKLFDDKVFE